MKPRLRTTPSLTGVWAPFRVLQLASNNWLEGTGRPIAPTTDGVTWDDFGGACEFEPRLFLGDIYQFRRGWANFLRTCPGGPLTRRYQSGWFAIFAPHRGRPGNWLYLEFRETLATPTHSPCWKSRLGSCLDFKSTRSVSPVITSLSASPRCRIGRTGCKHRVFWQHPPATGLI